MRPSPAIPPAVWIPCLVAAGAILWILGARSDETRETVSAEAKVQESGNRPVEEADSEPPKSAGSHSDAGEDAPSKDEPAESASPGPLEIESSAPRNPETSALMPEPRWTSFTALEKQQRILAGEKSSFAADCIEVSLALQPLDWFHRRQVYCTAEWERPYALFAGSATMPEFLQDVALRLRRAEQLVRTGVLQQMNWSADLRSPISIVFVDVLEGNLATPFLQASPHLEVYIVSKRTSIEEALRVALHRRLEVGLEQAWQRLPRWARLGVVEALVSTSDSQSMLSLSQLLAARGDTQPISRQLGDSMVAAKELRSAGSFARFCLHREDAGDHGRKAYWFLVEQAADWEGSPEQLTTLACQAFGVEDLDELESRWRQFRAAIQPR